MNGDLISREAVIGILEEVLQTGNEAVSIERLTSWLKMQPTVDAEPVIRCKDCEYYVTAPSYALEYDEPKDTKICRSPNLDFDTECGDQWMWMDPEDFCSCAKRNK